MPPQHTPSCTASIVIIGAGVFGLSTALQLCSRGYTNVTVLDRFLPPVPDGSSVDISRIIRPDYADPFYAKMGLEAMEGWKGKGFRDFFFESGLLCLASKKAGGEYMSQSKQNLEKMGIAVEDCDGVKAKRQFPGIEGDVQQARGYVNKACGWADARKSIRYLAEQCSEKGVNFITGAKGTVTSFIKVGKTIAGVRTRTGESVWADYFILATGAWTSLLLDSHNATIATGQPVGFLQLTPDEAEELRKSPVIIDLSTGWFCFPPTPDTHVLKMARHGYGYETRRPSLSAQQNEQATISSPLLEYHNAKSSFIPDDAERALREGLRLFYPQLPTRPFSFRRLCWYTDTETGDFIVDFHPEFNNLFVAFGGSGHAFKFLPILGQYIVDAFQIRASSEQNKKWAWREGSGTLAKIDGSRGGPPRRILSRGEQAKL